MNNLKAILVHRYFKEPIFENFTVSIENFTVIMERTNRPEAVTVLITGRKGAEHLRKLFFEIVDLLFIYLGSCPTQEAISINGVEIDSKYILDKYSPSKKYGRLLAICDINASSLNEATLQKLRGVEATPFYSLEYILSSGYDNLNIVHRVLLLLQAMEGIVSDSQRDSVRIDLQTLSKKTGALGDHLPSVYFICKNSFFNYHRKYKCEILKLLGTSRWSFIKTATDTRNWYSHFLTDARVKNKKEKKTPLTDGAEMLYYFEILFFASRLSLCEQMGLSLKESNIKESYYRIHDWVMETKYHRDDKYKSSAYSFSKAFNDMKAKAEAIANSSSGAN